MPFHIQINYGMISLNWGIMIKLKCLAEIQASPFKYQMTNAFVSVQTHILDHKLSYQVY